GAFSARVTALAQGVITAMWTTKSKTVTAVLLALCLLGGGTALRPGATAVEPAGEVAAPAKQAPGAPAAQLGPGLRDAWADLASPAGARAARAILALGAAPRQAVALFQERLWPVKADPKRVARLLADLDSPQFAVRQRATEGLEYLDKYAKEDLKKAL